MTFELFSEHAWGPLDAVVREVEPGVYDVEFPVGLLGHPPEVVERWRMRIDGKEARRIAVQRLETLRPALAKPVDVVTVRLWL